MPTSEQIEKAARWMARDHAQSGNRSLEAVEHHVAKHWKRYATEAEAILTAAEGVKPRDDYQLIEELTGALRFIMAFYEPGQTYLDTNAWKQAEAGGKRALSKGEARILSALQEGE